MTTQTCTSAATSINSTKLPAVYTRVSDSAYQWADKLLDYGCGRYVDHLIQYTTEHSNTPEEEEYRYCAWYGYDRFNRSDAANAEALADFAESEKPFMQRMVFCSNVLNVIDSDEVVAGIAGFLTACAISGAAIFVTVYEGDRSGIGRATKTDCFQRNEKIANYLKYFDKSFMIKKGVITNRPDFVK